MSPFDIATDVLALVVIAAIIFGFPPLARKAGWPAPGWPSLVMRILYVIALGMVWALKDFGLIPRWTQVVATVGVALAYAVGHGDDDDHQQRKGRRAAAWKRVREYLARGIQAPAPQEGGG